MTCDKSENSSDISHSILLLRCCPKVSFLPLGGFQCRKEIAEKAKSHLAGRDYVKQQSGEFLCFVVDFLTLKQG